MRSHYLFATVLLAISSFAGMQDASSTQGDSISDVNYVLIQTDGPLSAAARNSIAAEGLTIVRAMGGDTYLARREGLAPQMESAGDVAWRAHAPTIADKLHPAFRANPALDYAVVGSTAQAVVVAAYVVLQPDTTLDAGAALIAAHGGVVVDWLESINGVVAEIPADELETLAQCDAIQWIEPPLPNFGPTNSDARVRTQAGILQAAPYGLSGAGVSVLVYDGGTALASHVDFGGRLIVGDSSGTHYHSTHVAGSIGGDGTASGGAYRGMAPGVSMVSYGYETYSAAMIFVANPGDLENDYAEAIDLHGVSVANNSVGSNIEINGADCTLQGNYGVTSSLVDGVVRGSLGAPLIIVWAAGNERQASSCDVEGYGDYYSLAPPSCAKNPIVVGAINSDTDGMTSFSSWGPTDDGRLKPDVVAPGCQASGDGGIRSTTSTSTTAYATYCGTSMAAPMVTGVTALILEDYRALYPGAADPLNSTIKALLAHTAVDRGLTGPDYQYGYGSIRAQGAVDFMRAEQFLEAELGQDEVMNFATAELDGTTPLKITLAWDDYPAAANANPTLVNDLDLRVYDPDGVRHYPWTLNPLSPSSAAVRTSEDHLNNIEQVVVDAPQAGVWRIEVYGYNVPQGPQTFSLCVSTQFVERYLNVSLPEGAPTVLEPGVATEFPVQIEIIGDTLAPSAATLYARYAGEEFIAIPLTHDADDIYIATLPPPACDATPEFYVAVEAVASGAKMLPEAAPSETYVADVYETSVLMSEDFETDSGWTVENELTLTGGAWERGVPVGDEERGVPYADYDGSGQCYLTENAAGNTDVDGGATWLISPAIAMTGFDAQVSYALWYRNDTGNSPDQDYFVTYVSNDGSTWIAADTVGPESLDGWNLRSFNLTDVAGFTPGESLWLRFEASDDIYYFSVVEAAVDAVTVQELGCASAADCDGNGIVDADDIAAGRAADANEDGVPDTCVMPGDLNCDGAVNAFDIDPFVMALVSAEAYAAAYPDCSRSAADTDGDGQITAFDIDPFVILLVQGS